jgi:hypothetical protein
LGKLVSLAVSFLLAAMPAVFFFAFQPYHYYTPRLLIQTEKNKKMIS